MRVVVVDYGSGNLRSAAKALERAACEVGLAAEVAVTAEPEAIAAAERILLPGVGAFAECMAGLMAVPGLREALEDAVIDKARPFLGICVGMQLLASSGREHGTHPGLGWIEGEVVPIAPADPALKIPQMGWNALSIERTHPLLEGLPDNPHVYFVHSYHLVPHDKRCMLAKTDYGGAVTAAVGRDNLVGTQFHPEKSQAIGLQILKNFLRWRP